MTGCADHDALRAATPAEFAWRVRRARYGSLLAGDVGGVEALSGECPDCGSTVVCEASVRDPADEAA